MRVISKRTLVEYYTKHADAKVALEVWYKKVKQLEWNNLKRHLILVWE